MSTYAHPEVLVSTQWVADHYQDTDIVIAEVDVDTKAYEEGHIPGAVGWNWQIDLCDVQVRDIISKEDLEDLLSHSGISNDTTIILYGDNNNWFAAWAFWQLKIYGHRDVRLMDGGRKKWLMEGREMSQSLPACEKTTYKALEASFTERVFLIELMRDYQAKHTALVDVRSANEFSGQMLSPPGLPETCQRGGHIPGARNIGWAATCNSDGTFKSADELRALYEAQGITPDKDVVTYCRIGERSSHSWFVLRYLLGYPNVRNYDGSWTEWGNLVGAPVETGDIQPKENVKKHPKPSSFRKADATGYQTEKKTFHGVNILATSYQIGNRFYCHVTNEDPGATIARAEGATRDAAVGLALEKAYERL